MDKDAENAEGGEAIQMKGEIKPGVFVAVIIVVILVAGFFVFKGATGSGSEYPGQGVDAYGKKMTKESMMGGKGVSGMAPGSKQPGQDGK